MAIFKKPYYFSFAAEITSNSQVEDESLFKSTCLSPTFACERTEGLMTFCVFNCVSYRSSTHLNLSKSELTKLPQLPLLLSALIC